MKKIIFLFAAIIGFATMTALRADSQPEFKFETETYDFGKIPQGKPVTYDFKFKNIGDQPIIISNVESTCGCTVPKYTNTPVKSGESGVISVTFNAQVVSPFTKAVTIKSNAKTPVKLLYIKGEVVAPGSK